MWVPKQLQDLFVVSRDTLDALRKEIECLKLEKELLKQQLSSVQDQNLTNQNHFDWLRTRVNQLEIERAALLEKVAGVKVPVPEIVRQPIVASADRILDLNSSIFEDLGDDNAKKLGLPSYN